MNGLSKGSVNWIEVDESGDGQRVDNFLTRILKGVPRSHIYRILRSGEVRVNSGRVSASHRLASGDKVRVPPVRVATDVATKHVVSASAPPALAGNPLFEDDYILAVDKPAGLAVHGGSGISLGLIERLRRERPQQKFLELVHRLDRETSGVLLLAKKRKALVELHAHLRDGNVDKRYQTLVLGNWVNERQRVRLSLHKYVSGSGERRVVVADDGAEAHTVFNLLAHFFSNKTGSSDYGKTMSLLEAELKTGRTHQIRVHLSHLGFPIAGDDKYGDFAANKQLEKLGLKRMFLHSESVRFSHPISAKAVHIASPLPEGLAAFLESVKSA